MNAGYRIVADKDLRDVDRHLAHPFIIMRDPTTGRTVSVEKWAIARTAPIHDALPDDTSE